MGDLEALAEQRDAYTQPYTFIRGTYKMGGQSLPYYSIIMPAEDAVNLLCLPASVLPDEDLDVEELFQRDLNMERIEGPLSEYIRASDRNKFFSAFAVAMFPFDPETEKVLPDFTQPDPSSPIPTHDERNTYNIENVGPIQIRTLRNSNAGKILWNTKRTKPVIVDGQHRLAAIEHVLKDKKYAFKHELEKSELLVLLLVLDSRAGFEPLPTAVRKIRQVVRSIFVDLNSAVEVPLARSYLLDDRDIVAVCMREVMEQRIEVSAEPIKERVKSGKKLPLALVDWYTGDAKFDAGIHLTTVPVLYQIVDACLELWKYDPTDEEDFSEWIEHIVARLRPADPESIRRQVTACKQKGTPFSLNRPHVRAIKSAFSDTWSPAISHVLTNLEPYEEYLQECSQHGILGGDLEVWAALELNGKSRFLERHKDKITRESVFQAETKVNEAKSNLMFQVVYQKAIFDALFVMEDLRTEEISWQKGATDRSKVTETGFAVLWTQEFNRRFAKLLKKDHQVQVGEKQKIPFWAGAGLRPTAWNISWSKTSQKAIAELVVTGLVAPVADWPSGQEEAQKEAAEWVANLWSPNAKSSETGRIVSKFRKIWRKQLERIVRELAEVAGKTLTEEEIGNRIIHHAAVRLAEIARVTRAA